MSEPSRLQDAPLVKKAAVLWIFRDDLEPLCEAAFRIFQDRKANGPSYSAPPSHRSGFHLAGYDSLEDGVRKFLTELQDFRERFGEEVKREFEAETEQSMSTQLQNRAPEIFRRLLAEFEMDLLEPPPPPFDALAPIPVLQLLGPSERLQERADNLEEHLARDEAYLNELLLNVPGDLEDRRGPTLKLLRFLEWKARAAERLLRRRGYRFHPESGKARELPSSQGGRPTRLLTRVAGTLWKEMWEPYKEATGDPNYASYRLRRRIADRLERYFPAELIDPGRDGPIHAAIENYRANPDRYRVDS